MELVVFGFSFFADREQICLIFGRLTRFLDREFSIATSGNERFFTDHDWLEWPAPLHDMPAGITRARWGGSSVCHKTSRPDTTAKQCLLTCLLLGRYHTTTKSVAFQEMIGTDAFLLGAGRVCVTCRAFSRALTCF